MEMPNSDAGAGKMNQVDCIKEILLKYSEAEEQLDRKLEKLKQDELKLRNADDSSTSSSLEPYKPLNLEEAKVRNSNLLKSLEISQARLRSRSTFSPVEQILQQAIDNYRKKPALAPAPLLQSSSRRRTAQTAESYQTLTDGTLS